MLKNFIPWKIMFCFPNLFVCNYFKLAKSILSPPSPKNVAIVVQIGFQIKYVSTWAYLLQPANNS